MLIRIIGHQKYVGEMIEFAESWQIGRVYLQVYVGNGMGIA